MGTNIYVEGRPIPIVVNLRFKIEAVTFAELRNVLADLAFIDRMQQRFWPTIWPSFRERRNVHSRVLRFTKQSPPETSILCDPAWLAVLIALLAGYKNIKSNVKELHGDIQRIISDITGLTARQRQLLEIAVRMSADRLLEMGESGAAAFMQACRRVRQHIVGETGELPDIEVVNIDRSIY